MVGRDGVLAAAEPVGAVDLMTFEPMPSIAAPMRLSMRARSCTCGSEAALRMTVVAGRQRGRHQRVLGAHHRRLVHEEVARLQAAVAARRSGCRARARRARRARGTRRGAGRAGGGRSRRRRAAAAAPRRSGPAAGRRPARRRGCARPAPGSASVVRMLAARRATVLPSRRSTRPRGRSSRASIASTSRMLGTLCSTTCSSVSRPQASSGRAAFLLPAGGSCRTAARRLR